MSYTETTVTWAKAQQTRAAADLAQALNNDRPGRTDQERHEARREAERALIRARRALRLTRQREARLKMEQNPSLSLW